MLRKGESQPRAGRENPQQTYFTTTWNRTSGLDFHNIPQIEWKCPPQFMVDPNWKMEAGSESKETHIQHQRESRTTEAIYLQSFDIPANPSIATDVLDFYGDDSIVPIVQLDVMNDKTSLDDDGIPPITPSPNVKAGEITKPRVDGRTEVRIQPLLERDEVVGMAVALVALIKSKEPGNQIDLELLIELLRNPGMIEQMMKEHRLSANQRSIITSAQPQEISSVLLPVPRPTLEVRPPKSELFSFVTQTTPISVHGLRFTENSTKVPVSVNTTWSSSVPFTHSMSQDVNVKETIEGIPMKSESQINRSIPVAMTSVHSPTFPKFDVDKVRKLINDHGVTSGAGSLSPPSAVRTGPVVIKHSDHYRRLTSQHRIPQENPEARGSVTPVEQRPCVYFNSARGCRHGPSCWFQHVRVNSGGSSRIMKDQWTKRMKPTGGSFPRHT